jgi:hypothetical protein
VNYGDSNQNTNKVKSKVDPNELYKLTMVGLKSSTHANSSHSQLQGELMNKFINRQSNNREVLNMTNTSINHNIINSIARCNKTKNKQQATDLRDRIKQSTMDNGIYVMSSNKTVNHKKSDLRREAKDNRHIEDVKLTKNYSKIQPTNIYDIYNKTDTEGYKSQSRQMTQIQKNQTVRKNKQIHDTDNDVDMSEFRLPDRKETIDAKTSYVGRKVNTDFGDGEIAESAGVRIDMKNVLNSMIGY